MNLAHNPSALGGKTFQPLPHHLVQYFITVCILFFDKIKNIQLSGGG
jgi:hypothetical protein